MNTYYLYQHTRPDSNQIFYIGIGKEGTKRAWSTSGRNKHWKNIVAKNEGVFNYKIVFTGLTKDEAISKEIELISQYGRCINNTGCLVNVLAGGQLQDIGPNYNKTWPEEVKLRMSKGHLGNLSNSGKISITNGVLSTFIKKGEQIPEGWKLGTIKRKPYIKESKPRSNKGKSLVLTKEQKEIRSIRFKGNSSHTGMIWITNGNESKLVDTTFIIEGWTRGRHHITNPTGWNSKKKLKDNSNKLITKTTKNYDTSIK